MDIFRVSIENKRILRFTVFLSLMSCGLDQRRLTAKVQIAAKLKRRMGSSLTMVRAILIATHQEFCARVKLRR